MRVNACLAIPVVTGHRVTPDFLPIPSSLNYSLRCFIKCHIWFVLSQMCVSWTINSKKFILYHKLYIFRFIMRNTIIICNSYIVKL
jgi:hypothetical protein